MLPMKGRVPGRKAAMPVLGDDTVAITEVSLRDGLQDLASWVPTSDKAALARCMVAAGLTGIELTSFMRPDRVPQLADADELAAAVAPARHPGFSALVPNLRGLDRAQAAGFHAVTVLLSASDAHNQANLGSSLRDWLPRVEQLVASARERAVRVRAAISVAFGCPFEGPVPFSRVVGLARRLKDAGAGEVSLADTMGVATPEQVTRLAGEVSGALGEPPSLHLHDGRGQVLANAAAGLAAGVRHFDASLTGIGGCPFAPGAPGNLATEQLAAMLGERSPVAPDRIAEAAATLRGVLARAIPLPGRAPSPGPAPAPGRHGGARS